MCFVSSEAFHEFFYLYIYGTTNNLLQAIREDLNEIKNTAGHKALGIIDKLVTGSY